MRLVLVEQKIGGVQVVWYVNLKLEFELKAWTLGRLVPVSWNENETDSNRYVVLPSLVD